MKLIRSSLLPLGLALGLFLFGCAEPGVKKADAAAPKDLKAEIAEILKQNPEIVLDVLRENNIEAFDIINEGLQAKRKKESEEEIQANIKDPLAPTIDPARAVKGDADAPFTIVEYSDFQCPYCGRASKTLHELMDKYPGKYKLYFKHVPLHQHSRTGAIYYEAVSLQSFDLAWKFNEMAFERAAEINEKGEKAYEEFAQAIPGIDVERLKKDLSNPILAARVDADQAEAKRFKITGTPYFVINGVLIRGAQPLSEFEEVTAKIENAK